MIACTHAFASEQATTSAVVTEKYISADQYHNNEDATFMPGEIVTIQNNENDNVIVAPFQLKSGIVLPKKVLVTKNSFKKLEKWTGEKHVEFESPDLDVLYEIDSIGNVNFQIIGVSGARTFKGHLYKSKNILWVKLPKDDQILDQNIFVILPDGKLCSPNPLENCNL